MALTFEQQFQTAMNALTTQDVDLLTSMMIDPGTVTLDEQRTAAQKLGIKGGMLAAMVNTFSDPTVWLAYIMSRRFPTRNWIQGTIPKRFIGGANEFSGLSFFTRPVESFFRGTNVPKLTALAVQRQAEVMKVGSKIFQEIERRPNWSREMPIVSQIMEGVQTPGATPELIAVSQRIRGHMNELWGFLNQTWKTEGGFQGKEIVRASARPFTPSEAPRYLRDYLPHIPIAVQEGVVEISGREAVARLSRGKIAQAMSLKGENPFEVWRPNQADRLGSDFTRYQSFLNNVGAEVFSPRLFRRVRMHETLQGHTGQDLFVTDLNVVLQRYIHSVAKTYSVGAPLSPRERFITSSTIRDELGRVQTIMPTEEPIIVQVMNEGLGAAGGRRQSQRVAGTNVIRETVIPGSYNAPSLSALRTLVRNLQGASTEDEILWGNLFSSIRAKVSGAVGNMLGRRKLTEVEAAIQAVERNRNYRNKSNAVASYFYSTTLGLNPWSAIQNMLQPILTTAPAIGIGPTLAGYRVLSERMPKYFSAIKRQREYLKGITTPGAGPISGRVHRLNEALERGFNEAFPELAKAGIRADPRLFDVDIEALEARGILAGGRFAKSDDFFKLALQPFTQSELSNQIISFFGGRHAQMNAVRLGEVIAPKGLPKNLTNEWLDFEAGMVVNATQFRPGPGSRTVFQSMLPSWARQFTSFPVRLYNFFAESTVRGAMSGQQVADMSLLDRVLTLGTGRNVGTLARTYLYSKLAVNGAREVLGVDLGGSLGVITPFVNVAPSNQPFGPFPLPPAPAVAFGLLSFATTRDAKRLQPAVLPGIGEIPFPKALIPGGIAITRAARAVQQWRPDLGGFADENERLMYRGNTPDLILSMIGLPLEKGRRARDAMERIQANRGTIREFRRRFAAAAINMDYTQMDVLRQQWSKAFPEMTPLAMSHKDVRRYREQQMIPMVSRMLRTLGRQADYLEGDIYEYDPDLVAAPRAFGLAG